MDLRIARNLLHTIAMNESAARDPEIAKKGAALAESLQAFAQASGREPFEFATAIFILTEHLVREMPWQAAIAVGELLDAHADATAEPHPMEELLREAIEAVRAAHPAEYAAAQQEIDALCTVEEARS